jgi:hemin uptake protein HemP
MTDRLPSDRAEESARCQGEPLAPSSAGNGRAITSEELFAGGRVVRIRHAGEEYRLMITRNDRLILQK